MLIMSFYWYTLSFPVALESWILVLATLNSMRLAPSWGPWPFLTMFLEQYLALPFRWWAERRVAREYQRRLARQLQSPTAGAALLQASLPSSQC